MITALIGLCNAHRFESFSRCLYNICLMPSAKDKVRVSFNYARTFG